MVEAGVPAGGHALDRVPRVQLKSWGVVADPEPLASLSGPSSEPTRYVNTSSAVP